MTRIPALELPDGGTIPQIGFGVFQIPPEETAEAVQHALAAGYRSLDTATIYRNEAEVGEGLRASGIPRDQVFVTTKLWNTHHGRQAAGDAIDRSLERLGLDHVDLYLIHWPMPSEDRYVETWQTLIELRDAGRTRAIGTSNFMPEHLQRVIDETGVVPAVNQVELNPTFQQAALREFHAEHGIVTEAWAPLAQGRVLDHPTIAAIAERVDRTPAQVVLRWHLQIGNVVIPKSVTPERIKENLALDDFELSDEAMAAIGRIETGRREGPDPLLVGVS